MLLPLHLKWFSISWTTTGRLNQCINIQGRHLSDDLFKTHWCKMAFWMLFRNRKIFAISSLVVNLFASQIGEFFLPHPVEFWQKVCCYPNCLAVLLSQFGELCGLRQLLFPERHFGVCRWLQSQDTEWKKKKKLIFRIVVFIILWDILNLCKKGKANWRCLLQLFVISSINFITETVQTILIKFRIAAVNCFRWNLFCTMSFHMPPTLVEFLFYSKNSLLFKKYIVPNLCTFKVHGIQLKQFWLW